MQAPHRFGFFAIEYCTKLDQLYLSFTQISLEVITEICRHLDLLVLDVRGIRMRIRHCEQILRSSFTTLFYFHLSLAESEDYTSFRERVTGIYIDCSFHIFNHE